MACSISINPFIQDASEIQRKQNLSTARNGTEEPTINKTSTRHNPDPRQSDTH